MIVLLPRFVLLLLRLPHDECLVVGGLGFDRAIDLLH